MIRFYKTPIFTRLWYSSFIWKIPSSNAIYLSFDDGPHPDVTPWVLRELKKANAKATFFCVGKNLIQHNDIAKQIIAEGHQIGNHTHNHMSGWNVNQMEYHEDVIQCDKTLHSLGVHNEIFRPPYGRIKQSQAKGLSNKKIIMWSHLSWDFDPQLTVDKSIRKLKNAKAGSILAFHDSEKAFKNLKLILPEILSHFQSKGLKFEAIS
ncbi:polysaccharide deacetylase family protein [Ekhidna sp.]|uniref:polysaccharide deacetylase family protein n=1 Tax=Ekhidna sp. TaxID=2608089 RepID=UPI003B514FF8